MKSKWQMEKSALQKVQDQREELEKLRHELEQAENDYDLNRAAELRHGRIPQLQKELEEWKMNWKRKNRNHGCSAKK